MYVIEKKGKASKVTVVDGDVEDLIFIDKGLSMRMLETKQAASFFN